jgi:hypothetical protein
MELWESFEINQRVVDDFSSRTLAAISSDYARLIHIAFLRDLATGTYRHEGLEATYSDAAVNDALKFCHEQSFRRILEMPLEKQEADLRECLRGMEGDADNVASRWLEVEFYRLLVPFGVPDYLRDLFCSNLRALLEVVAAEPVMSLSNA